jgi:hypothetical protein
MFMCRVKERSVACMGWCGGESNDCSKHEQLDSTKTSDTYFLSPSSLSTCHPFFSHPTLQLGQIRPRARWYQALFRFTTNETIYKFQSDELS